jgi:hypothetical protein
MFPLIKNFKATGLTKAFFLNALVTATIVVLGIEIRRIFEDEHNEVYGYFNHLYGTKSLSEAHILTIVFPATFLGAIFVYLLMYALFEYGGNFLITDKKKILW